MIDIKAIKAAAEAANKHDELSLDQLVEYLNAVPTEAVIALCDEIERLKDCLKKANDQAEHFEREWYLRGDEVERLRKDAARYQWLVAYFVSDRTDQDDAIVAASEVGVDQVTAVIDADGACR